MYFKGDGKSNGVKEAEAETQELLGGRGGEGVPRQGITDGAK